MWKESEENFQLNLPKVALPDPEKNYENCRVIENITMFFLDSNETDALKSFKKSPNTSAKKKTSKNFESKRISNFQTNNFMFEDDSTVISPNIEEFVDTLKVEEEKSLMESLRQLSKKEIQFPETSEMKEGIKKIFFPCNRMSDNSERIEDSPSLYFSMEFKVKYFKEIIPMNFPVSLSELAHNYFGINSNSRPSPRLTEEDNILESHKDSYISIEPNYEYITVHKSSFDFEIHIKGIVKGSNFLFADDENGKGMCLEIIEYEEISREELKEKLDIHFSINQLKEFPCDNIIHLLSSRIQLNYQILTGLTIPCLIFEFEPFFVPFEQVIQTKISSETFWSREHWCNLTRKLFRVKNLLQVWSLGFELKDVYWVNEDIKVFPRKCNTNIIPILNCIAKAVKSGIPELYTIKEEELGEEIFNSWEAWNLSPESDNLDLENLDAFNIQIPLSSEQIGQLSSATQGYSQYLRNPKIKEEQMLEGEFLLSSCLIKKGEYQRASKRLSKTIGKSARIDFLYGIAQHFVGEFKSSLEICEKCCISLKGGENLVFYNCLKLIASLHLKCAGTHSSLEMAFKCFTDAFFGFRNYLGEEWKRHSAVRDIIVAMSYCAAKITNYHQALDVLKDCHLPLSSNYLQESSYCPEELQQYRSSLESLTENENLAVNESTIIEVIESENHSLNDQVKANILETTAYSFVKIENYGKALKYYRRSLLIKAKMRIYCQIEATMAAMGSILLKLQLFPQAESYFKKSYSIGLSTFKNDNHPNLLPSMLGLGIVAENNKKLEYAISFYQKAMFIHSLYYGSNHFMGPVLKHNMARSKLNLKKYEEALRQINLCLELKANLKFPLRSIVNSLLVKAAIFEKNRKRDSLLKTLLTLERKCEELNDPKFISEINFRISGIYLFQDNYDKALSHIEKAFIGNFNSPIQTAELKGRQGEILAASGQTVDAEMKLSEAISVLEKNENYTNEDYLMKIKGKYMTLRFERKKRNKTTESDEEYYHEFRPPPSSINQKKKKFVYFAR